MGWRGALRSLEASAKRAEREYERKQKILTKQRKLDNAESEVSDFHEEINLLLGLHKKSVPLYDWAKIGQEESPVEPKNLQQNELKAKAKLEHFRPNWFHRWFGLTESKISNLKKNITKAIERDGKEYRKKLKSYNENYFCWEKRQKISNGIINGNLKSYLEVLEEFNPYEELDDFMKRIEIVPLSPTTAEIVAFSKGEEVVPDEMKTLLRSGRLSVKDMPKGKFYEIYQDHICSCALYIAKVAFAVFPLKVITVTILNDLLNMQTGYVESQPILSVLIPKDTINSLNFSYIDPSEAMKNFIYKMDLKKTTGFKAVKKVAIVNE